MNLEFLDLQANSLGWAAYCTYIPMIIDNNPGLNLEVDPNPYDCENPPFSVYFADPALKAAVEEELGIENPTQYDMLMLGGLFARGLGITDLTGLEYATNLEFLHQHS